MKKTFYRLGHPSSHEQYRLYGRPEWARQFGPAEWSELVNACGIVCTFDPGHQRFGGRRSDLTIVLPSPDIGDFVWTWYSDCIVTDFTLSLFREAGFSGFETRPVTVEKVKGLSRKRKEEVVIPPLWELVVIGKGGDAAPESRIHIIDRCETCSLVQYSSFRNGIIVDEANWDGSDFFTINGYPKFILVTDRVKDLIISHQLTDCALIPSHELEWKSGTRPEESLEEKRTLARKDLALLLADLENPDTSQVMNTIDALGEKKDPQAVDPLIEAFTHPDGLIREAAASAVARIGGHAESSEQVRTETLSKVRCLLNHDLSSTVSELF